MPAAPPFPDVLADAGDGEGIQRGRRRSGRRIGVVAVTALVAVALASGCTGIQHSEGHGDTTAGNSRSDSATSNAPASSSGRPGPPAATPAATPAPSRPLRTIMVNAPATVVAAHSWSPAVWNRRSDDSGETWAPNAVATVGSTIVVLDPADGAIDWFDRAGRLVRHLVVQPSLPELLLSLAVQPGTSTVYALSSPGCCSQPILYVVTADGRAIRHVVPAVAVADNSYVPISVTADGTVWLQSFNDAGWQVSFPVFAHGRATTPAQARARAVQGDVMGDGARVTFVVNDSTVDTTVTAADSTAEYRFELPGKLSEVDAELMDRARDGRLLFSTGGVDRTGKVHMFAGIIDPAAGTATLLPINERPAGSNPERLMTFTGSSILVLGGNSVEGWIHRYDTKGQ